MIQKIILCFLIGVLGCWTPLSADNYAEIEKRVMEGLRSTDWEIRVYSANILGQIKSKEAVNEIKGRIFKESHRLVMAEYCKTLGLIGDSAAIDILIEILNAEKKDVLRNQVPLDQLGKKQREEAEAKIKEDRAEFEVLYSNALWAVGRLKAKKATKTLCSWAITGTTPKVRQMAIQSLIEIRDYECIDILTRMLGKAGTNKLTAEENEYRKNAFEALLQLLPKFKQAEAASMATESGESRITNTTVQNANFIYTQLFRLPNSFGRLVTIIPAGDDTYLWFESKDGIFRIRMDIEGNFDLNALKIGRFDEEAPSDKK